MATRRHTSVFISGLLILALLTFFDLFRGSWTSAGIQNGFHVILTTLRVPRVLTAIIAGGGLALAGAQMQSILRNPLADPHIMGISSGASLGAAIALLAGGGTAVGGFISGLSVTLSAVIGAGAASAIIISASRRFSGTATLLVFGVMLGFIVNASVTILQAGSNAESLKVFHSWSAGSFSTTSGRDIYVIAAALACRFVTSLIVVYALFYLLLRFSLERYAFAAAPVLAFINRKGLDIILFGDEFTLSSGVRPEKVRLTALLSCCLVTGAITAFCGPIGFVGIVAPHIARATCRTSAHRAVLPASFLFGAVTGVIADIISQTAGRGIPVSSAMAIVGIPVIIYILFKKSGHIL